MSNSGNRSTVTVIAAVVVLVSIAAGLGFVLLLRPADSEYNNTIPAVMGILTMVSAAVPALLSLLKSDHAATKAEEAANTAQEFAQANPTAETISTVVTEALHSVTSELPIVKLETKDGDKDGG